MLDDKGQTSTALFAELIARHCTDSIVFTDTCGKTVWANAAFEQMCGYSLSEVAGRTPGEVLQGDETDPRTVAEIRAALADKRRIRVEILNYSKSGDPYWIDLTIVPIYDESGQHTHFMSIERDVSERKELIEKTSRALEREKLRRQERKLLSKMSEWLFSAQSMDEVNAIVARAMPRLFPGTFGKLYIYSNSRDALDSKSGWGDKAPSGHIQAQDCWALRRGRAYSYKSSEIDLRCAHASKGEDAYCCFPIVAHGDTIGLLTLTFEGEVDRETEPDRQRGKWELGLLCAEQISLAAANVRLQKELMTRSLRDHLTGLWNRRWFLDMAGREIRRSQERGERFSLIMIDVDHFKAFNDNHGHDMGDTVLRNMGREMALQFVDNQFPCRIGGEEFAVLCNGVDAAAAFESAEAFRERLADLQARTGTDALPPVTISAGVACLRRGDDLDILMRRADEALYAAKRQGRDRVVSATVPGTGLQGHGREPARTPIHLPSART